MTRGKPASEGLILEVAMQKDEKAHSNGTSLFAQSDNRAFTQAFYSLASLLEFQEALDIAGSSGDIIRHMLRKTQQIVPTRAVGLLLVEEASQEFKLVGAIPASMKGLCQSEMDAQVDEGAFGVAVNHRQPTVAPTKTSPETGSTILVPLIVSYKTLGMLIALTPLAERQVKRGILISLSVIAKQFALTIRSHNLFDDLRRKNTALQQTKAALQKKVAEMERTEAELTVSLRQLEAKSAELERLKEGLEAQVGKRTRELLAANEELQRLYRTDGLTGLPNRQFLEESLKEEDSVLMRDASPVTVVVIDVNNLKFVNDTQGHEQGDLVIKEVAQLLKSCARETDLVARFGGDEFAVIMPEAQPQAAKSFTRRVQLALRRLNQSRDRLGVPKISVAIGYADTTEGDNITATFNAADYRMYEDKQRYYRQIYRRKQRAKKPLQIAGDDFSYSSVVA
ncbi:MAG: diguanylate cyclase [Chloroflexi bacterium]|nr:diguanylate cyclase [Chloroflexota bacterium]